MHEPAASRAVAAGVDTATEVGLSVDDVVVLHNSNKLTARLLPCDVLARIAPAGQDGAEFEIEIARQLGGSGGPVAAFDPRVEPRAYERDGFVITLWTYYERPRRGEVSPVEYADALERLHVGMRELDVPAPHFTDRIAEAQELVSCPERTPALEEVDRALLAGTLRSVRRMIGDRGAAQQLVHGEPHPGNLLVTRSGPVFIDFETCCRGPVEFDLAHAPEEVSEHYPGLDHGLLRDCRILVLAMITAWRWDRDDQFPNGRRLGVEWLARLRTALDEMI